jgi:hypothetical protein
MKRKLTIVLMSLVLMTSQTNMFLLREREREREMEIERFEREQS